MSKLFPMFKKKGKGKEEDVNDEDPKRKMRVKVKEALLSPGSSSSSPSKSSKNKKKGKGGKEKRSVNGKVSSHSPEEAEVHQTEDFYVDDKGSVRIGSLGDPSVEDESLLSVGEPMPLVNEKSYNPFDEDECQSISVKDGNEEADPMCASSSETHEELVVGEPSSDLGGNGDSSHIEESSPEPVADNQKMVDKDVSMTSSEGSQNGEDDADERKHQEENGNRSEGMVVTHEADDEPEFDSELVKRNIENEAMEMHDTSLEVGEPKVVRTDDEIISVDSSQYEVDPQVMCNKIKISVDTKDEIKDFQHNDAEKSENLMSEHDHDAEKSEDPVSECELFSSRDYDAEKSENLTSERDLTSSQDSEDDFDSAQEDWDEEDSSPKVDRKDMFGQDTVDKQVSESNLPVHEATNGALTDNENTKPSTNSQRDLSSVSSVYEDTTVILQNSSLLDETSDYNLPSVSEDSRKTRKNSGSEKLVRKLSGLSSASSDAFNEELDDLLDEELDRLSEEEEAGADVNATPVHNAGREVDSGADGNATPVHNAGHEVDSGKAEMTLKVPISEPSSQVNESEKSGLNNLLIENSGGDVDHPSSVIDSNTSVMTTDNSNIKTPSSNAEKNKASGSHLSPSEETLDQVKDSGYYSLPVSPNPGAVVRASGEGDSKSKGADDSFGESEEEGMITPPSEISTLEDKTENPKELVALIEEDLNTSVVSESNALYQTCCEGQETVDSVGTPVKDQKSDDSSNQAKPERQADVINAKQGVNLKVIIPKEVSVEKKEITSPKCGSPTKSRVKSPLKESEECFTPDPVGDRFLHQAVSQSHGEAEARLAQRRAARAEARELRLRELEKQQQQDQENDEEKQFASPSFAEPTPRAIPASRTSVARTAALNSTGQFSRRSSEDSTTDEAALPANVREMRAELKELDEKFRKAMITNAQLDNEKSTLTYEVELIKDKYTELEEGHTQLNKEHRKKCTEYEQLRKVSTKLQEEVKILRGLLQERDQLIQEYGLVVVGEEEENGEVPPEPDEFSDMDDLTPRKIAVKKVLLSQEAAGLIEKGAAKGSLDVRLKKFGEEKNDLEDQVRRLKLELDEERNNSRRRENGLDYEKQKEQSKTLKEYEFKVEKAKAEVLKLQANVARLEALSTRYKTQSEELEKSEEELKSERRKLQRELRDAQSRLEEVETTNNHLIRRFDKLKNARSTLLKDLSQEPA